ncbi:MAG: ribosome-associated translation inhibitor RaiA [Saprospiraceae bacterium]
MKVHTEAVQFKADQKLIDFIEKRLVKLSQYFDRIIDAKVTLKLENTGKVKDKIAEVRIKVPGDVLIAKNTKKTFEASIDESVNAIKRQLKKHKEKRKFKRAA